jgi:hypothetical protein
MFKLGGSKPPVLPPAAAAAAAAEAATVNGAAATPPPTLPAPTDVDVKMELVEGGGRGLHSSTFQLKLFWSHLPVAPCSIDWGKPCTQRIPQNVLSLSRKVDECKPLAGGGGGESGERKVKKEKKAGVVP